MRPHRALVVAMSALEAIIAVAVGLAIPLLPLTVLWVTRFDNGLPWDVYYRASADIWLLGHGVDMKVTLDAALAASIGVTGADVPFEVSIAPLAFALITSLLGVRLGRRAMEAGTAFAGLSTAIITFTVGAVFVALSATHPSVSPSPWQSVTFPSAIFALGVMLGARGARGDRSDRGTTDDRVRSAQRTLGSWVTRVPESVRAVVRISTHAGGIATAGVVTVAALLLAVAIVGNFGTEISLYEGLQGGVAGSLAMTVIQLLFMPVFVVWTAAWLVGPGFAIGVGSSVSPMGSLLGPVPSFPIFGALPATTLSLGFLGLAVPIVAGFVSGYAARGRSESEFAFADVRTRHLLRLLTPLGIGLCGGLIMSAVSWLGSGSAGPGRLAEVGPHGLLVGAVFALELIVGSALGMVAPRPRTRTSVDLRS